MIDGALGAFLREGLGIHIGTRNARFEPNGARAAAVAVEPDGVHLVVYVAAVAASRVLPDLTSNGQAAVVFARPADDRACQIKGVFVTHREAREDERPFVEAQWNAFLDNLERIGIPRGVSAGWVAWPVIAIRLKATAIFEQTPKPGTGELLAGRP
jgi:hypothetical protein